MININNKSNIEMACECLTIPFIDCLHYIFFCCGKKFRCDICNTRFKHKLHLAEHIKYAHPEIFSFNETLNLQAPKPIHSMNRNNNTNSGFDKEGSVYLRIRTSDAPDHFV